ncbi:MAG: hypothetical protein NTZ52_00010 [Chlamydiae bacterium]|nr:hypothetical protein [Chlamydiota bacterium]
MNKPQLKDADGESLCLKMNQELVNHFKNQSNTHELVVSRRVLSRFITKNNDGGVGSNPEGPYNRP